MIAPVVVQDNFLDKEYFKTLQNEVFSGEFPWFLPAYFDENKKIRLTANYPLPTEPALILTHVAYGNFNSMAIAQSDFFNRLTPLFESMGIFVALRVKLNLLKREEKIIEPSELHIDIPHKAPKNTLTSVLYMNTNNGYTKFETGEKVKSVENRLVTFPNSLKHTGSSNSCKAPYRCVMNIDWINQSDNYIE